MDEALCSGWIAGQKCSRDATTFLQRFPPRRARSVCSLRNTEHIARLEAEGRMRLRGRTEVDKAQADGRWGRVYQGSADAVVPDDLANARARPGQEGTFRGVHEGTTLWHHGPANNSGDPGDSCKKAGEGARSTGRVEERCQPCLR